MRARPRGRARQGCGLTPPMVSENGHGGNGRRRAVGAARGPVAGGSQRVVCFLLFLFFYFISLGILEQVLWRQSGYSSV